MSRIGNFLIRAGLVVLWAMMLPLCYISIPFFSGNEWTDSVSVNEAPGMTMEHADLVVEHANLIVKRARSLVYVSRVISAAGCAVLLGNVLVFIERQIHRL